MAVLFISIAAAVRIIANSFANVFQKKLAAAVPDAFLINGIVFSLLGAALIPRSFFLPWGEYDPAFWLYAAAAGIFGAFGNLYLVKALETGELSVLGPINAWKPVVGMIGGLVFLSEIPVWQEAAGLCLILAGSRLLLAEPGCGFHWRVLLRRDIRYRFFALFLTAVEAVFLKKTILLSSVELSFLLWCWFGAVFSFAGGAVLQRGGLKRMKTEFSALLHGRRPFLLAALALCFGGMQYATNLVFRELPVGIGLSLFQLSSAVNLWLGWRMFHEGGMRRKMTGTILTAAGAVCILLCRR